MLPSFPFSAIVGQEPLKRALLLGVIQPSLGGVLVRGTKGVAKSTAVRALAALLPPIETVAGCPFRRRPGEDLPAWPLPADAAIVVGPVPLVELPLGATEDRVLGCLHLEKALRGERAFEPGLLAAANRGILYVDEVNLLPDHLVDVLLDAAPATLLGRENDGEPTLRRALDLAEVMVDQFWDAADGGFFYTGRNHEALIARGCDRILVMPLVPQYAAATTATRNTSLGWTRMVSSVPVETR